jgi:hypothetical protein
LRWGFLPVSQENEACGGILFELFPNGIVKADFHMRIRGPSHAPIDVTEGIVDHAEVSANLQGLNYSTSVQDLPADVIDGDGNIIVPPPPFYDPGLFVPLPPN